MVFSTEPILRSGLLERSARATIDFPATETPHSPYPIMAGLAVLLLLGILAALFIRTRRKSARDRQASA